MNACLNIASVIMTQPDSEILDEKAFLKKKLLLSMIVPGILLFLMWFVKIIEILFDIDLSFLGIRPLEFKGLPGIFLSPLIHENFGHLFNNSIPVFFLGTAVFYFYSEVAFKVFVWTYLLTGLLVWLMGRASWHIGASGLIYGLASFLFFSGIIRRYFRLIALSLLIVFLYGSMVWGMLPELYKNVSWESHMLGFVSGILLAVRFRNEGPQKPVYSWETEEIDDIETEEGTGEAGDSESREDRESSSRHPSSRPSHLTPDA
jgi:membrane associated rhomboid family serine protease